MKKSFSKTLLLLEGLMVFYTTIEGFCLARMAITLNFSGSLPWIATMVTAAWGAYGASAAFYYNKAKAENTKGGVIYDAVINKEQDCE